MSNSTHLLNNSKAQDRIDELEQIVAEIEKRMREAAEKIAQLEVAS